MKLKELLLGGLLGGGAMILGFWLLETTGTLKFLLPDENKNDLLVLFCLVAAIFLALAAHELGHLLTGLALGFKFWLFVVGPLGIKRTEKGNINVYFNTDLAYAGGVASTAPVTASPENYRKFAAAIIAGPLTSLALAVVCLLVFPYLAPALATLVGFTGIVSMGIFLATTLPGRSGGFFTDRARFQRLMRPGKTRETEQALLEVVAISSSQNSYRNLNPEKLALIREDDDVMIRYIGHYYSYMFFKELENTEQMELQKEEMLRLKAGLPIALQRLSEKL